MKQQIAWILGVTLLWNGFCAADVLHTRTGPLPNVQVLGIRGNELVYVNPTGRETTKTLDDVRRLEIDTEPDFTAAEAAYESANWEKATSGYERTIKSTNKPWLRQYVGLKLLETANKSGNFPAAVAAYLELVQSNPAVAQGKEPKLPDAGSTFLDSAAADVERALSGRLQDSQRAALLKFLLNIYQKKNDTARVVATAERLAKITGDSATGENQALLASLKLSLAKVAFEKKDYARARQEIDSARAAFIEPATQAEALYLLASIDQALAKDDPEKLQDAAVAYMRVVAHFPTSEHAGKAMVQTAQILEKLGQQKQALSLYQQAAAEHPATGAREHVERVKQAGN